MFNIPPSAVNKKTLNKRMNSSLEDDNPSSNKIRRLDNGILNDIMSIPDDVMLSVLTFLNSTDIRSFGGTTVYFRNLVVINGLLCFRLSYEGSKAYMQNSSKLFFIILSFHSFFVTLI